MRPWAGVATVSCTPSSEAERSACRAADWRIADSAGGDGDPLRLLGYVERVARDDYQPVTEIRFFFNGNRPPRINNDWLRSIMATADAATGLRLVKEPAEPLGASAYAGIEG